MPQSKHETPRGEGAQVDKFRDLARELECDDDEAAFDEKLRKLAKAPREPKDNEN
jgi:hypothetical protein